MDRKQKEVGSKKEDLQSEFMALEGVRVIDCTINHAGPAASAMLADLGAEVIHVEQAGYGDIMRGLAKFYGQSLALPEGRHMLFEELNRNKKSVTINLKHPKGKEIIYRLVEGADIFATNMRSNFLTKVGLDYDSLTERNPQIIYAAIDAMGSKGPEKDSRGVDILGYARSGAMMASGEPGAGPVNLSPGMADRAAGLTLAFGIMGALYAREKFGIGQQVRTSLLSGMMILQSHPIVAGLFGKVMPRFDRKHPENPLYNYYQCKDGVWICLACWQEKQWIPFCEATGLRDLIKDPKFENLSKRTENSEELVKLLDNMLAKKSYDEWKIILGSRKELLFSIINTVEDVGSDEQILANEYVKDWDHPTLGKIKMVGFPVEFSKTKPSFRYPAPQLGQHTEEILLEGGYSWDEIDKLREDGAI